MTINFPNNPGGQTPLNQFSPNSTPEASTNGITYIFDGDKWIAVAQGDTTLTSVFVGENPPNGPIEGDLWWDTDDGRLYLWYEDVNSSQWVDASPDSIATSYWSRNGTELSPVNDGDSIRTAGTVTSGGDANDGANVGAQLVANGSIRIARASGASATVLSYTQGTTEPTCRINGDGSAIFRASSRTYNSLVAGDENKFIQHCGSSYACQINDGSKSSYAIDFDGNVGIGGDLRTGSNYNPNIELKADGSATFAKGVISGSDAIHGYYFSNSYSPGTKAFFCRNALSGGNDTAQIYHDGSAKFAGTVTATADSIASSTINPDGSVVLRKQSGDVFKIQDVSANPKVTMTADGVATFNGTVSTQGAFVSQGFDPANYIFQGKNQSGTEVIRMNNNGTAVFAGNVTAPNITNTYAALLRLKAALLIPDQDVNQLRARLLEALENITEEVD